MTAEHFDGLLNALANRQPFQPFTVELIGGQKFEIDYPRALINREGVAVYLGPGGVPVWFGHKGVVSITGDLADKAD